MQSEVQTPMCQSTIAESPTVTPGRRTRRLAELVLFGVSSVLASCGDSGNGPTIVRGSGETSILVPALLQGARVVALQSNEMSVAAAWVQGTGNSKSEMVAQLLNEDLQKIGDEEQVSGESDHIQDHAGLCHTAHGWNAIWSDTLPLELITTSVTLDPANVHARWSWPPTTEPVVRVNPNEIGAQSDPEIACLADGRLVATWANVCVAVRRVGGGIFSFEPPECVTEPVKGSYLQVFSPDGVPEGELVAVSTGASSRVPVAPLASGQFVLLAGSSIQVRSGTGELVDEHLESDVDFSTAVLACTPTLCAAAVADDALRVWLIDPTSLESTSVVTAATSSQPDPNRTLRPFDPSVACDPEGICIVSWVLLSETIDGDTVLTEPQGVYASAFEASSGKFGPEAMIFTPESTKEGALLAAQADGIFATARIDNGTIAISRLVVK